MLRECLRLARGAVQLDGRAVDGRDQAAQRIDRVVDRVGDGPGDVLGNGRLHGEVAVGKARQLIEQAQDRLLVAVGLLALRVGGQALLLDRAVHAQRADEGCDEEEQARGQEPQGK